MKITLKSFQEEYLLELHQKLNGAKALYSSMHTPQVVAFTAPTGAGKTIFMSHLIEDILCGADTFEGDTSSIVIWLSDSPELNEQSRLKIITKCDKVKVNDCITITDDNVKGEVLEDGKVYFLNTQKLAAGNLLVTHGEQRQYTIWQILSETIRRKGERLYLIIDEAHRGAKTNQTSIMQKFVLGDPKNELHPLPIVIGMSATIDRFTKLIGDKCTSTLHKVIVPVEKVRDSGLLKQRIELDYPSESALNKAISVLESAAEEWADKCVHWHQYTQTQHYANVDPVLVVQVEKGNGKQVSATDLNECVRRIEKGSGIKLKPGEVVHTFGEKTELLIGDLLVPYCSPSAIEANHKIKVVFFKEALTTGWDCPRAETMMSFCTVKDYTYIAQLLGRMVRNPHPQTQHVDVDDTLNEVKLFLPYYDQKSVDKVIEAFKEIEGGEIADIDSNQIGKSKIQTLAARKPNPVSSKQTSVGNGVSSSLSNNTSVANHTSSQTAQITNNSTTCTSTEAQQEAMAADEPKSLDELFTPNAASATTTTEASSSNILEQKSVEPIVTQLSFDPLEVLNAINKAGIPNYEIQATQVNSYYKSLFRLCHLLTMTGLYADAVSDVKDEIVQLMACYIADIKSSGEYDELVKQALEYKMNKSLYDTVSGDKLSTTENLQFSTSSTAMLDRDFLAAELKLGGEGIGSLYEQRFYDENDEDASRLHVILYAKSEECKQMREQYAKKRFSVLTEKFRALTITLEDKYREQYNQIVRYGMTVSPIILHLKDYLQGRQNPEGKPYTDHLYLNEKTGTAIFKLNDWEEKTLKAEQQRADFVCWYRNPTKGSGAILVPYMMNKKPKPMYPDLLIVRKHPELGFVYDILEPHGAQYVDGMAKAKGLAKYAEECPMVERIQMIRVIDNKLIRLNMTNPLVRDALYNAPEDNDDQLSVIFQNYGFEE